MNKPAFSRWALESQPVVAMESFGDLIKKFKDLFKQSEKAPSKQNWKKRQEYIAQLLDYVQHRYGDKHWVERQTLTTEPIEIGDLNPILNVSNKTLAEILKYVEKDQKEIDRLAADFSKLLKEWEVQVKALTKDIYREVNDGYWDEFNLFSDTREFDEFRRKFKAIPLPLEQIDLSTYMISMVSFVKQHKTYITVVDKFPVVKHTIDPLTKEDILKLAIEIMGLLETYSRSFYPECFSTELRDAEDNIENLGELSEMDDDAVDFVCEIASDGVIDTQTNIFTNGYNSGLVFRVIDMAYGLDKLISRSIK